jgi:beta-glucosidase
MLSPNRPARLRWALLAVATATVVAATVAVAAPATAAAGPIYLDPAQPVSARVADLLHDMSLDEKIGQMIQTEAGSDSASPAVVRELNIGSVLAGGDSAPTPNTATAWADMRDGFQQAALGTRKRIPIMFGVDAVHGYGTLRGATVFPHNIGLGAAHDPALIQRIGRATAEELAGTGMDWNYAPCLCVTRNDRWGRVYESFGEKPVDGVGGASLVTGLQDGTPSITATAKHYIGDGGTEGGRDKGDTNITEAELREIHLPPFAEAVRRGVGAVMVSYSSFNKIKMQGNRYLITDVLKNELKFGGIVISDWNGIEKVDGEEGFTARDVRDAVNAGTDVLMVTEQYRTVITLLKDQVDKPGGIPLTRIEDANRRILTRKFTAGLFEKPLADRSWQSTIGSAAHRAVAREAVQKSQVVLKNSNNVLPLPTTGKKIFVAGKSADDIGLQSGGWTVTWQGKSGPTTPGTTILQGMKALSPNVTYNKTGTGIDASYGIAVAVVGELPYAEEYGDRLEDDPKKPDLKLDATDRALLAKLKASGVPTVVVLVSGRPMDVSAEIGDWAGLVAAWLPGTEGQGVADVLFGAVAPTGKLTVTWMQNITQQPINDGDGKVPLFPYGQGLTWPGGPVTPPPTAPPTSPGVDARSAIQAASFSGQFGTQTEDCNDEGCGRSVGYIAPGDQLWYDAVDFGATSPATVQTRIASGASSGGIEYRLDSPAGPLVGTVAVTATGGWTTWKTTTTTLTGTATGKHRLYAVFTGPGGDFVNVNWFRFS